MSIMTELNRIPVDEHVINGLVQWHFASVIDKESVSEDTLRQRIDEEPLFLEQARRAAADAVIYSTLALTLESDKDFADLAEQQTSFEDVFFADMRAKLFTAGIESAKQTAAASVGAWQVLNRRAALYLEISDRLS